MSHIRPFQAKGTASVEARKLRRGLEGLRSRKEASRVCWASVRESAVRRLDSVLRALGRLGKDFEEERHIVFTLKSHWLLFKPEVAAAGTCREDEKE